jgi:hypothetical protein
VVTARAGGWAVTKRHVSEADRQKLIAEIGRLSALNNTELKVRWKAGYGTEAPPRPKPDLLRYAVAYRLQERALGGLKSSTRRLFERVSDHAHARSARESCAGAQTRGGNRTASQVGRCRLSGNCAGEGSLFRGKRHRSLYEVAHLITGSRWSGPLFFGLKAQDKEAAGNGAR